MLMVYDGDGIVGGVAAAVSGGVAATLSGWRIGSSTFLQHY